jgi:hypothetical protein
MGNGEIHRQRMIPRNPLLHSASVVYFNRDGAPAGELLPHPKNPAKARKSRLPSVSKSVKTAMAVRKSFIFSGLKCPDF